MIKSLLVLFLIGIFCGRKKIKSLGYNLVVMWESDWTKQNKTINTTPTKTKEL
jgi:hypothetical protein